MRTLPFGRPLPPYQHSVALAVILGGALFFGLLALLPRSNSAATSPAPDRWAIEPTPARLRRRQERLA